MDQIVKRLWIISGILLIVGFIVLGWMIGTGRWDWAIVFVGGFMIGYLYLLCVWAARNRQWELDMAELEIDN